ncbi:fructose-bisphosphate aldolase class I [bacterium]|nr:fructose-bisphosphate aldolase class I [bacterium]|tara:strand:- start:265 stop:1215 length:951 start_codon:yes stop_codon:yes gene_type:complete
MTLKKIVKKLCDFPKGILAADEGIGTIKKRFDMIDVENTQENRTEYRKLLFSTPNLDNYISGVITYSETFDQRLDDDTRLIDLLLEKNILVGIKLDSGLSDTIDNQKLCNPTENLEEKINYYFKNGASFAKWRALFVISENTPTQENIEKNAEILADYALKCTQNGLVPIVEPEILLKGSFDSTKMKSVTKLILDIVIQKLNNVGVDLAEIVLKPSFVRKGLDLSADPNQTALDTVEIFNNVLPENLGGISFLSGGMNSQEAINTIVSFNKLNFHINGTFCFGRALQTRCLQSWKGKSENFEYAQKSFLETLKSFM